MRRNAERVAASVAPPETKPYLDETLEPGYAAPTENETVRLSQNAKRVAELVPPYARRASSVAYAPTNESQSSSESSM